jgi:WD40 repeat protein
MVGARVLSIAALLAAGLVVGAEQEPGKGDALPEGAAGRLGTPRWRHGAIVTGVLFGPDGKTLLSVTADKMVHVWEFPAGKELRRLKAEKPMLPPGTSLTTIPPPIALSRDGKLVAVCFGECGIYRWEVDSGKELPPLTWSKKAQAAMALAFSPDASQLASLDMDGSIHIWDLKTNKDKKELLVFHPPSPQPGKKNTTLPVLAYADDGKSVVGLESEIANNKLSYAVKIWDAATGKEKASIAASPDSAFGGGAVSADGRLLAASSQVDGSMTLFDLSAAKELRKLPGGPAEPRGKLGVAFAPGGKKLYSFDLMLNLREWDVAEGKELWKIRLEAAPPFFQGPLGSREPAVAPDGKTLAIARDDHGIDFVDLGAGKVIAEEPGHRRPVVAVAFTADGKEVLARSEDNRVRRWNLATAKESAAPKTLTVETKPPLARPSILLVSQTCDLLLATDGVSSSTRGLLVMDADAGKELGNLSLDKRQFILPRMVLAPNNKVLAVERLKDSTIELYDLPTLKLRCMIAVKPARLPGKPDPGTMILSADGQTLAAFADVDKLGVFDTATGKKQATFQIKEAPLGGAFSPDASSLALDLGDDTASVWECANARERWRFGQKRPPPQGPTIPLGPIITGNANRGRVAFSPSGKMLALGDIDGKVHVWDTVSGRSLADLAGHAGAVEGLAFAPDGMTLASASADTTVLLWDMKRLQPKDAK